MRKLSFDEIKVGQTYETAIPKLESGTLKVLVLSKTDKILSSILDANHMLKYYADDVKKVQKLSHDQIMNGETYDISPRVDDSVVLNYLEEDGRITTLYGDEIEFYANE